MVRRLTAAFLIALGAAVAPAQVLDPARRLDQDAINRGEVGFQQLFLRGAELFSTRYTTEDGLGEGPTGRRRRHMDLAGNKATPFLRINGLDAQSCQECHDFIGPRTAGGRTFARETGSTGGSAGIASNVMIFEDPGAMHDGIVRNPPHVFGLGYIQRLAEEMTHDLQRQLDEAQHRAWDTSQDVRVELRSKGIAFGAVTVASSGGMDFSELEGIEMDLVVRPYQHKGIASTLRNFAAGAMNFHFSIQPTELTERFMIEDDGDGRVDEIQEGDITALAVFLATLRPPMQDPRGRDADAVARGRALFESVGCADCHTPTLRIDNPNVVISDPRPAIKRHMELMPPEQMVSLRKEIEARMPPMSGIVAGSPWLAAPGRPEDVRDPGITINLTHEPFTEESLPRLAENSDGSIDVPLFSNLRRHRMGRGLADTRPQVTEVLSLFVEPDEFLTRPLWGVADSGPWLHDGRATTLREAILMHAGDGSEANAVIDRYTKLDAPDQQAIIEFLNTLRVRPLSSDTGPREATTTGVIVN